MSICSVFGKKNKRVALFKRSINSNRRLSVKADYDFTAKAARTCKNDETYGPDYTGKRAINFNATLSLSQVNNRVVRTSTYIVVIGNDNKTK